MSVHAIYYRHGAKYMTPVMNRQVYMSLRDSKENRHAVKQNMVQMNYSCLPNADGSLKGSTRMSTSVGMDVDIPRFQGETDQEYLRRLDAVPGRVLEHRQELGLLMLERSASKGFHVVFTRRADLSQEENLQWAAQLLQVEYDAGAKDITRVFFTPADKLLFLSDDLFLQEECEPLNRTSEPGSPSPKEYAQDYEHVPYSLIVEELENQLGGVPDHGSRNQFIFNMACHLRHVCNDDPEWIARVLPDYGESRQKWMNTIRSACQRNQLMSMPRVLKRALEMARAQCRNLTAGSSQMIAPPPMPRRLPPLIKLLISKTPAIYQAAVAHAVFPALAVHLWKTRFRYTDNVDHEATLMNVLMAGTGAGKNCISAPIDCIMQDIRQRDAVNLEKERLWKEEMQTRGANKDKKKRPEGLVIQEVDPDMTNAALVLRLSEAEEHFLYTRMNEIDQFDALKTSARSKAHFQIMCLSFDPGNTYGQTRVGMQSVSARVCVRFNWNASTTILKGQKYFRNVLTDGPISRINFCTIPEQPIGSSIPIYGKYDEQFQAQLKPYIDRLNAARGLIQCTQAERFVRKLQAENADFARLSQSRTFENLSFRATVIAYLKAMVLFVAQGEEWNRTLEDFIRWSLRYDLWCKMKFFGDAIDHACGEDSEPTQRRGPRNLLDQLPQQFTEDEAVMVRRLNHLSSSGTTHMLSVWKSRKYIDLVEGSENTYFKTDFYLSTIASQISESQFF